MSKIKIMIFIGIAVLLVIGLNWVRKHDFIDVFTAIFIMTSVFALSICGLYVFKEVYHG